MNLEDFKQTTRIVIVDDDVNEGNKIKDQLEARKIPSVFYHITGPTDLPTQPFQNLRVVFLDLNFNESIGALQSDETKASIAVSKLNSFIDKNSFYILVVWSSNIQTPLFTKFKDHLDRSDISKPIKIIEADKNVSLVTVMDSIDSEFNSLPLLRVFHEWEYIILDSQTEVLSQVILNNLNNDYLSKLLCSLSNAVGGSVKKSKIPIQALTLLNSLLDSTIAKKLSNYKLGSFYRYIKNSGLDDINKSKLNYNFIFDPHSSVKGSGSMYTKKFPASDLNETIKRFIDTSLDSYPDVKKKIKKYFIDVTPLCDSAQGKGNTFFIEALLYPKNFKQGNNGIIKIKKGSFYTLDKYFTLVNGEEYGLTINLKSYCTNSALIKRCSSHLKLRGGIIIDMQHKIGQHISRPGHRLL